MGSTPFESKRVPGNQSIGQSPDVSEPDSARIEDPCRRVAPPDNKLAFDGKVVPVFFSHQPDQTIPDSSSLSLGASLALGPPCWFVQPVGSCCHARCVEDSMHVVWCK